MHVGEKGGKSLATLVCIFFGGVTYGGRQGVSTYGLVAEETTWEAVAVKSHQYGDGAFG